VRFSDVRVLRGLGQLSPLPRKPLTRMNQSMEHHEDSQDQEENDQEMTCPLFMQSLPRDFAHNPSLAALASLLNDDHHDPPVDDVSRGCDGGEVLTVNAVRTAALRSTGAKIRSAKSRSSHRKTCHPYTRPESKSKQKQQQPAKSSSSTPPITGRASVGEAQLFLKMWKL
jgi:hypothetical protein